MGVDDDSYVPAEEPDFPSHSFTAGTIKRIRLENFMCHSSLELELGDHVNFITGENGSGKSAILTALCVAFGCRAKGTQRASTLKDFIKTGCSYAAVHVDIKNQGVDAFKPDIYGDLIKIERRIGSVSSILLKDVQGRKVASRKAELLELVEHFNVDVENPCVIMSQDKSREFLQSGTPREKFDFFYKATLLQHVSDLLQRTDDQLKFGIDMLKECEASMGPMVKELNELQVKIRSMEHVEEISLRIEQLKKKLAWSWVYDEDRKLKEHREIIHKLKNRIPLCEAKIDAEVINIHKLKELFNQKKARIAEMVKEMSKVKKLKSELQDNLSLATKRRLELKEEHNRKYHLLQQKFNHVRLLDQQIKEIYEQNARNTQDEEFAAEEKLRKVEADLEAAQLIVSSLKEGEGSISETVLAKKNEISKLAAELNEIERRQRETQQSILQLQRHQANKITAFGGDRVLNLLHAIERHHHKFRRPPIGPIGAHVNLANGDLWAPAVEHAIGKLLNAFIVTVHGDCVLLRKCAKEANYNNLPIIIYDFSRPRLIIPREMLPRTNHVTTLSVIHTENPTVFNVLVDEGGAERQVLVKDYDIGKTVAFNQRDPNLKEVFTLDGYKMFSRGSVQTILPPNKRARTARLCSSFVDQIKNLERESLNLAEQVRQCYTRKRKADEELSGLGDQLETVKRRCVSAEREVEFKKLAVQDLKKSRAVETDMATTSTVHELQHEHMKIQAEIQETESLLQNIHTKVNEAEAEVIEFKKSFEKLCDSVRDELGNLENGENELLDIEKDLRSAEEKKTHYEDVLKKKVLPEIAEAEEHLQILEKKREVNCGKASKVCPETEIEALEGLDGSSTEQLSDQLKKLQERLKQESKRHQEPIDDLRMLCSKRERTIKRKRESYDGAGEKLKACRKALDTRWRKFQRNASLLKRDLLWKFVRYLRTRGHGYDGRITVSYEEQTLKIEVKTPQDATNSDFRDIRSLSGGERSFATLCFSLALHSLTESPFRAMDEFDVFMDAVGRKIGLDNLVDFALDLGAQFVFITPNDISMVKQDHRIKKIKMAAPRS